MNTNFVSNVEGYLLRNKSQFDVLFQNEYLNKKYIENYYTHPHIANHGCGFAICGGG